MSVSYLQLVAKGITLARGAKTMGLLGWGVKYEYPSRFDHLGAKVGIHQEDLENCMSLAQDSITHAELPYLAASVSMPLELAQAILEFAHSSPKPGE